MDINLTVYSFKDALVYIRERWGINKSNLSEPLSTILNDIERWGCKSIAVEEPYYDEDFISEYSSYYSTTLSPPSSSFCTRLHFFTKPDIKRKEDLVSISDMDYLGFTVIRPLKMRDMKKNIPIAQLSKTILRYPYEKDKKYILCKDTYTINILGKSLSLVGTPFMQQDSIVDRCCHATLWMISKNLAKKTSLGNYTIGDISKLTFPRLTNSVIGPSQGMDDRQMIEALFNMGYNPIYYKMTKIQKLDSDFDSFDEITYKYLESGLPVIVNTNIIVDNTEVPHSYCLVGHNYNSSLQPEKRENRSFYTPTTFIPSYIRHDDAKGPYVDTPKEEINEAESLLIPLPAGIYLNGEEAEMLAEHFILMDTKIILPTYLGSTIRMEQLGLFRKNPKLKENINNFFRCLDEETICLRTYLSKSNEYKDRILRLHSELGISDHYRDQILSKLLYKYIWIVEFGDVNDLINKREEERHIFGELVFDATSNKHQPGLIFIHFPGLFIDYNYPSNYAHTKIIDEDGCYLHRVNS